MQKGERRRKEEAEGERRKGEEEGKGQYLPYTRSRANYYRWQGSCGGGRTYLPSRLMVATFPMKL